MTFADKIQTPALTTSYHKTPRLNRLNQRQLKEFADSGINADYASYNFKNAPKKIVQKYLNPEGKPNLDLAYAENEYLGGWMSVHNETFKPYKPSEGMKYRTLEKGSRLYEVIHPLEVEICKEFIYICEGAKKAVAVAQFFKCRTLYYQSLGHALGCVNEIVRLSEESPIRIALDNDYKPEPLNLVNGLLRRLNLQIEHFEVSRFFGKGIDDAIAENNQIEWVTSQEWLPQDKTTWNKVECSRFLSPIEFPKGTRICVIQSGKGTGKSHQLAEVAKRAKEEQRPIIIVTHRISLARALARKFGIPYIDDSDYKEGGSVGLCINSIAKVKQSDLEGAYIFIDEADQVLDDLMFSDTMKYNRTFILDTFRQLCTKVNHQYKGTIFLASADIEARHISEYQKFGEIEDCQVYKIKNEYTIPKGDCHVYVYSKPSQNYLYEKLNELLEEEQKLFVGVAAQKVTSKYGTQAVETFIKQNFPHLKVIRIDSETIADSLHPAYRAIERILDICENNDVVIASPTLGTGVDIRFNHHVFDAVICNSNGITSDTDSTRQMAARVRDTSIPRYVFTPKYLLQEVIQQVNPEKLLTNKNDFQEYKQKELKSVEKSNSEFFAKWIKDYGIIYDDQVLNYFLSSNIMYLKEAANYGAFLLYKLNKEGFNVIEEDINQFEDSDLGKEISDMIKVTSLEQKKFIAKCEEIDDDKYKELCSLENPTKTEKLLIESHKLRRKWGLHPSVEVQENIDKLESYRKIILASDLFSYTQDCLSSYNFDFSKKVHIAHDDILNSSYYQSIVELKNLRDSIQGFQGSQEDIFVKVRQVFNIDEEQKLSPHAVTKLLSFVGLVKIRSGNSSNYSYSIDNETTWKLKKGLGENNEYIELKPHLTEHTKKYLEARISAWRQIKTDINLLDEARKLNEKEGADSSSITNKYTDLSTRAKCLSSLPELVQVMYAIEHQNEFIKSLKTSKLLAVDIETYAGNEKEFGDDYDYENPDDIIHNPKDKKGGLNPIDGRIRLVTLFDGENLWVVEAKDLKAQFGEEFKAMFKNPWQKKILHNSSFDLRFLRWQGFINQISNIADTMLGSRCLWGDMGAAKVTSHSLKQVMKHFFNEDIDKEQQTSNWGNESLSREQIEYAAGDAFYTYHAYHRLVELCKDPSIIGLPFLKESALTHWETRNASIPGFIKMQSTGYIINENKLICKEQREKLLTELLAQWTELCPYITPNQTAKIKEFIFKKYGVAMPSISSKDTVGDNEFPELILRQQIVAIQRDLILLNNTVEVGKQQPLILGLVSGTGRSNSGMSKVSQRFFNFQSIPKKANKTLKKYKLKSLREMFDTDCIIDLPASHGRIAAELADDDYAIECYTNKDKDMHCETASILASICFDEKKAKKYTAEFIKKHKDDGDNDPHPECKQLRSAAKNTYYGWLNGAGASTIKAQIQSNMGKEVSKAACQKALVGMETNFKKTVEFAQKCLDEIANPENQFIVEGKIFGFMNIKGTYLSWYLGKVGQSINVPATKAFACIWSLTESLIMNKALAKINTKFEEMPEWGANLQNFIHDEFNLTYQDVEAAKFAYEVVKSEFGNICHRTISGFDAFEKCVEGIKTCADK